uniref:glucuronosyltransferase n=1 Tax=Parascaris equorum TaxID=6256 RepID=A0A914RCN6_PAREQ
MERAHRSQPCQLVDNVNESVYYYRFSQLCYPFILKGRCKYNLGKQPKKDKRFPENKKTLAFISHAGFNSIQEAINSGVPIVAIPLFGDQYANSRIVEKRRIGITISKSEFNERNVVHAIKEILRNNE